MSVFFTPKEAVDIRMLGNDDFQRRDRMRLLKWSKYVYQDLKLTAIKSPVRRRYAINKRTNSIDLPCNNLQLSSVSILDHCGNEYPVYRNNKVLENTDIVDVSASKDCGCEFECNNKLCNVIKGYVAVVETVTDYLPDGQPKEFECISRKGVDDQGFLYEQKQYPKRIYEDNVWVNTIVYTETNKLCKVEVDANGCVCDTEENINSVCDCCGISNVNTNLCCIGGNAEEPPKDDCGTWIYKCSSKMDWFSIQCGCYPSVYKEFNNIYNVSELGDRLIFPPNFGWDHVIVRYYEDNSLDIKIPIIALRVFVIGLMYWDCMFNDKKQALADKYGVMYSRMKQGLVVDMNRRKIADLAMIMHPPTYIPSYTVGRTNKYEGGGRW